MIDPSSACVLRFAEGASRARFFFAWRLRDLGAVARPLRRSTVCRSPAIATEGAVCTAAPVGPRTAEGLARSRRSRWKHGQYSAAALAEQKRVRELLSQSRELSKQMRVD